MQLEGSRFTGRPRDIENSQGPKPHRESESERASERARERKRESEREREREEREAVTMANYSTGDSNKHKLSGRHIRGD